MAILRGVLISAVMLATLAGCAGLSQGKREKVHLEDPVVTAKVKEALAKDPVLQKYSIDVRTVEGKVVLRGHVDTQQDAYQAAKVVNNVEGVQSLLNLLSEQ